MTIIPLDLAQANALVAQWHRHHNPVVGHRFSLGVLDNDRLCGAAICGRPVARHTDHMQVIEVTRLVTDGTRNACSILYGACARVAREMGYARIQTFTLDTEIGASLRASGWTFDGKSPGGSWKRKARNNKTHDTNTGIKHRWVRDFRIPVIVPNINVRSNNFKWPSLFEEFDKSEVFINE